MRKFLAATGFLLLTAALAAGAWWAWPILFPPLPTGWLSTLARADAALLQNRPDIAKAALDPPAALPVNGWLQWEKRVARTAALTGDWKWAVESAAPARQQYPGNTDLTAFYVWALLQDQRPREALLVAEQVLKGTGWDSLRVQAAVESAGLAAGWDELRERAAQPGSSVLWDGLASLDTGPEVSKNALLAALADGRMDAARAHLDALSPVERDKPPFDRLQALMAYDQGDFGRAAALLKSLPHQPDTLLVLADVYLHLGDPGQAKIIYDQLLAEQPGAVPLSLAVNRASLALEDDPALAVSVLARVTEGFSPAALGKVKLLMLEARFRMGETDSVRVLLDRLAAAEGESDLGLDAELLKGRLLPGWSSVPRLWSLLHRHPDSQPLAERLAWLLLAAQDYAGAHRALDLHENALAKQHEESPWWSRFLRGLVFAAENRLRQASDTLATVPVAWRDATFWADWALVASVSAQQTPGEDREPLLNDALERLTKALDLLPPSSSTELLKRRSLWLTRRGEVQAALVPLSPRDDAARLKAAAQRDFTQAVQLDATNLKAAFLLRQTAVSQEKKP